MFPYFNNICYEHDSFSPACKECFRISVYLCDLFCCRFYSYTNFVQFITAPVKYLFTATCFCLLFQQIHGDTVQNQLVVQCVEIPLYLTLYSPAIDWILQCIAYRAPEVSKRGNA